MRQAESLADSVAAARREVRTQKARVRTARADLQTAAARLDHLEAECAKRGIRFIR